MVNWQPRELVRQASEQSLNRFLAATEHCLFLVILLDEANSDLAKGLLGLSANEGEPCTLGFRTGVNDNNENCKTNTYISAEVSKNDSDRIPASLFRLPCHLAAIRKRSEGSFLQNVSVGRARNNDIVLRHHSVSKFHAVIEVHEGKRLIIKDSDSLNHTFVDGQQVTNRLEALPGQTVKFGTVEARVVTGKSLWRALKQ